MSAWPIVGRLLGALPKVIELIRARGKPTVLAPPLGESEAQRAIRLEDERRAAAAIEPSRKGQD